MSLLRLAGAADRAAASLRGLRREARRGTARAAQPADIARAVEQALDRKQAPGLEKQIKKLGKAK